MVPSTTQWERVPKSAPSRDRETAPETSGGLLSKGLAALQFIAEHGSASVADVAAGVGLSRSSAYRLVDRLRASGYLQEAPVPGTVRLGPLAARIGLAALNQMEIMDVAPARLLTLSQDAGETVNLAVPERDEVVYVYQAEGPGAVKVTAHLGTRRPVNSSALGKAYLAALPGEELAERLRVLKLVGLTNGSITDAAAFATELERTRARGYAVDEQEAEDGVACVGAAVRDYTGRPVAAISIAGPAERMPAKRTLLVPLLLVAAEEISQRLGYLSCTTAEDTPLSALALARICEEAGVPPGVVNVVTGAGRVIGDALVRNPITQLVTVTGSVRAGREILAASAENITVVSLELGGKAPVIVMDDADVDAAVEAAAEARFWNCGQVCTCNERTYVHARVYEEFVEKFVDRARSVRIGDPMRDDTEMGPKVNRPEVEKPQ